MREPEQPASYVYLGLRAGWQDRPPDGTVGPDAVTGSGSGFGPGEPPGATPSTVAEIIETAAEAPASSRRSHSREDVTWP